MRGRPVAGTEMAAAVPAVAGTEMAAAVLAALGLALSGCAAEPAGLARTVRTGGPTVVFDLSARPLPEIPFPNDLATRLDPTSATGRRVNVSLDAPTEMERKVRENVNRREGFSTFGPIWARFDRPLDLIEIRKRHIENDDLEDDAVYLVDLETGAPVALDLGQGNYPVTLQEQDRFFDGRKVDLRDWDARRDASNLVLETVEEDLNHDGSLQPGEDTDNDGTLDHPNLWPDADMDDPFVAYKGLVDFYERETDTLILRPLVPLKEKHRYAVVLTGRLVGEDGRPVQSPFPWVNHLRQTEELDALRDLLPAQPYGLGFGRDGEDDRDFVAFAWSFTTQATTDDLVAVRNGLYGQGPLAWLAQEFPAEITWDPLHSETSADGSATWKRDFYRFDRDTLVSFFDLAGELFFGKMPDKEKEKLKQDLLSIDSMVLGTFETADLMCYRVNAWEVDPYREQIDERIAEQPAEDGSGAEVLYTQRWAGAMKQFAEARQPDKVCAGGKGKERSVPPVDLSDELWQVDPAAGTARVCADVVPVIITIPRETAKHKQPFPVAIYYHGYSLTRTEMLGYAGYLAKLGIASVGVDAPGHGNPFYPDTMGAYEFLLDLPDFLARPAVQSLARNRVRDLSRSGWVDDSGGDFWTIDVFHTRDEVRQTVVDAVQLVRALRSYDGKRADWNVTDHPGQPAGDFDGNGVPDIGGPDVGYFIWGQSLGGIVAMVSPAVDPYITAAAPVSGGGGLADIAVRSVQGGVREAVQLKMLGPDIIVSPFPPGADAGTMRTDQPLPEGKVYLYWYAGNWYYDDLLPVGEIAAQAGDLVRVTNEKTGRVETGRLPANRKVMVPVQADAFDPVTVEVVASDGKVRAAATEWTVPILYQGTYFCPGDRLAAPTSGWGHRRNTPEIRKLLAISQLAVDPGDPINYGRHVFLDPLVTDEKGQVRTPNLLVVNTDGDMNVPVNTGMAYARAAGVLDFDGKPPVCPGLDGPDTMARYGMSGNDLLLANHVMDSLEKLQWFEVTDASGKYSPEGTPGGKIWGLYDPDDLDEGTDGYDAASPSPPLRWTRQTLAASDLAAWQQAGCKKGPMAAGQSGLRIPYLEPVGEHTFEWKPPPYNPNFVLHYYMGNMVAYFFATGQIRNELCMEDQDVCGEAK